MPGTFAYTPATNTVTVTGGTSGSPADFASFVTADRAGAGTSLLAAWGPNSNTKALTYQVRAVELLALLITFVVAGKTAETDYIFITGTDAWGASQTEALNVTAGNGTYTTTKRFRTITNIDCSDNPAGGGTVWANGTVAVTQPVWGVIWNKGNFQYQVDAKLVVGDGSTSTYFKTSNEQIFFPNAVITANSQVYISVLAAATFQAGNLLDATIRSTSSGSVIRTDESSYSSTKLIATSGSTAIANIYSSLLIGPPAGGHQLYEISGTFTMWNTIINGRLVIYGLINGSVYNVIGSTNYSTIQACTCSMDKVTSLDCTYGVYLGGAQSVTARNMIIKRSGTGSWRLSGISVDSYAVDCECDAWSMVWSAGTGSLYRQQTLNLHVADIAGNNISGATVTLKDAAAAIVFSVNTGADGKITFTGQDSSPITNAFTHTRYYYNGGALSSYKGPWTLTVTKAGYQDYQDVIVLDRKMDLEVALLIPKGGSPTNLGLVPLGIKQVAL
jgi:hypothetical protein